MSINRTLISLLCCRFVATVARVLNYVDKAMRNTTSIKR